MIKKASKGKAKDRSRDLLQHIKAFLTYPKEFTICPEGKQGFQTKSNNIKSAL